MFRFYTAHSSPEFPWWPEGLNSASAGYEQELLDAGDQLVPYLAQQAQAAPTRGRAA